MRIAIVHYHLKRGGVTKVIGTAIDALPEEAQLVVLAGTAPANLPFRSRCRIVPGLRYSNDQQETPTAESLLADLRAAAHDALGGEPDVWHIHNHSLGKNRAMPGLVNALARSGAGLLLQMHDFAEDGRPENHQLNESCGVPLYPVGPRIHYACINARDAGHFQNAGLLDASAGSSQHNPERPGASPVHLLPNAVEPGIEAGQSDEARQILRALGCERLLLYPVRAVRRKNLGELLLWSTCLQEGEALATTLGPTNQNFAASYQRWQTLVAERQLPVHFGIGESGDWSFASILAAADVMVTTSIAEGFGLAFLEPWLFGKPIIGRDLPAITADFRSHGIALDALYPAIHIPASWIDPSLLETRLAEQLARFYRAYQSEVPDDALPRALAAISPRPGYLDFGGLDEPLQESVIRRVSEDATARKWLAPQFRKCQPPASKTVRANASIIRKNYAIDAYGARLMDLYEAIRKAPTAPLASLDQQRVLAQYLRPENFRLLRS